VKSHKMHILSMGLAVWGGATHRESEQKRIEAATEAARRGDLDAMEAILTARPAVAVAVDFGATHATASRGNGLRTEVIASVDQAPKGRGARRREAAARKAGGAGKAGGK